MPQGSNTFAAPVVHIQRITRDTTDRILMAGRFCRGDQFVLEMEVPAAGVPPSAVTVPDGRHLEDGPLPPAAAR
ncbi:MAG: hypothetical protein U1F25_17595 [Rubrivivax sp.]